MDMEMNTGVLMDLREMIEIRPFVQRVAIHSTDRQRSTKIKEWVEIATHVAF
jgi:hypothetical protein